MVKGHKFSRIGVVERMWSCGTPKAKDLEGLHNFTAAVWGEKFVGESKRRW